VKRRAPTPHREAKSNAFTREQIADHNARHEREFAAGTKTIAEIEDDADALDRRRGL
jgi:hypothetical protein